MRNMIDAVSGGLRVVGVLVGIGLIFGIPLFIFNTIKQKRPRVGKIIFGVVMLAVALGFFFASMQSFIAARNIQEGTYVSRDIGEVWHDEAQLKRNNIYGGIGCLLVGCGAVWYCWMGLRTKAKQ